MRSILNWGICRRTLIPNEEFNIEVWLDKELILKNDIPVDNYKGSINFWVEETKNYLSIPVDIKFKSSIGYAILWILIGAFALSGWEKGG